MSATSTAPTFTTAVLGQTEKALNAILERELAGTGLTELQWITLTVTVTSGGSVDREQLVSGLAGSLKVDEAAAEAHITTLAAAQLVQTADGDGSTITVTDAGQQLHSRIRTVVGEITQRMWGDLPAEDLDSAGRVLSTILDRANAELAAA